MLSSEEGRSFPGLWGIDPANVHVTPYWASNLTALQAARDAGPAAGDGASSAEPLVFAGGDSLRDYRPLLEAAEAVQGPVRIATRLPLPARLPANVTAGPVPPEEFLRLAVGADVAVVPLVPDALRSGGQKTYLGAMGLGQAVVVPRAPGVLDHVEPDVTGLVPAADDPGALADAINLALSDPALRSRLGAAAQADVAERFSPAGLRGAAVRHRPRAGRARLSEALPPQATPTPRTRELWRHQSRPERVRVPFGAKAPATWRVRTCARRHAARRCGSAHSRSARSRWCVLPATARGARS